MAGGLAFVEILMMIIMIPTYVHISISFTAAVQMQSLCFSLSRRGACSAVRFMCCRLKYHSRWSVGSSEGGEDCGEDLNILDT